jgi:hypothetical protein
MPKITELSNLSLDSADSQDLFISYDPNSPLRDTAKTITGGDLRRSIFRDGESDIGAALTGGNGIDITGNTISLAESGEFTGNLNVGGDVVITGDLRVDGEYAILNTQELTVEDTLITIANGATDSASVDGAGLLIDHVNASMTYRSIDDTIVFNKDLDFPNQDGGALDTIETEPNLDVGTLNWNRQNGFGIWYLTSEEDIRIRTIDSDTLQVPGSSPRSEYGPYIFLNTGFVYTGTGTFDVPPGADSAFRGGLTFKGPTITTWQPTTGKWNDPNGPEPLSIKTNTQIYGNLSTESDGKITGQFADSSIGSDAFKNVQTLNIYDSNLSVIRTIKWPGNA